MLKVMLPPACDPPFLNSRKYHFAEEAFPTYIFPIVLNIPSEEEVFFCSPEVQINRIQLHKA